MQEVAELSRKYQAVIDACTLINSTLDLSTLLETITRKTMEIMNAEASSLLLLDEQNHELSFKVALGEVAEKLKEIRIEVGTGIAGWVARTGEPLLIPDVSRDSRFFADVDKKTGFITRTMLCVPVKSAEKILGVIEVLNKKDDSPFTDSDIDFLMAISNQAAIAIENALLYQQLTTEKEKIETILTSMSDGVIVMDENAGISMMNPAARRIFDVSRNQDVELSSSPQKLQFILNEVKGLQHNSIFDVVLMKPENMILSNSVTLLRTPEGKKAGAVMVLRNVTETRSKEISRSEFLTLLSFKMFAPLEHLMREITLVAHETDRDISLRGLYEIEKDINVLKNMVQKLHYYTELEAGPLRMERSHYRISDLVDEAVSLTTEELEGLKINAKIPFADDMIRVDGGRIIEAVMLMIFFLYTALPPEQELSLDLQEREDSYVTSFGNPLPNDLVEILQSMCTTPNLVEDFCKLHAGSRSLELLEFAFVRHLLDAHGGNVVMEKKPEGAFLSIVLPKEKTN